MLTFLKISTPRQSKYKRTLRDHYQPVFILSTGRTGTKFLAEYLNNYTNVFAVHEPRPSRLLRMWSMAYLQGDVAQQKLSRILPRLRNHSFKKLGDNTIYIESNPFITGFANAFKQDFANPIIIHLVRDPREYIRSSLNYGTTAGFKGWINRNLPYFYLDSQKVYDSKRKLSDIERVAVFWWKLNDFLNKSGEGYSYYYRIKFEDLFDEEHSGLNKILQLLDINENSASQSIDKNKQINKSGLVVLKNKWQEWDTEQCRQIDSICHELMELYGYGNEPEWIEKLKN